MTEDFEITIHKPTDFGHCSNFRVIVRTGIGVYGSDVMLDKDLEDEPALHEVARAIEQIVHKIAEVKETAPWCIYIEEEW